MEFTVAGRAVVVPDSFRSRRNAGRPAWAAARGRIVGVPFPPTPLGPGPQTFRMYIFRSGSLRNRWGELGLKGSSCLGRCGVECTKMTSRAGARKSRMTFALPNPLLNSRLMAAVLCRLAFSD